MNDVKHINAPWMRRWPTWEIDQDKRDSGTVANCSPRSVLISLGRVHDRNSLIDII